MKRLHYIYTRATFLSFIIFLSACGSSYKLVEVSGSKTEMNSTWDNPPDAAAMAVLHQYKEKIDSIMSPVVGRSSMDMPALRPGSTLSNLMSDVLRESAEKYLDMPADIGLINIGGLRSTLKKGDITYGDIYEILPFENSLCVLRMRGTVVKELMENVASVYGEGISNVKLIVSANKEILECTVGGQPIDDNRIYLVATLDYLAEGNDKLVAFREADQKFCRPDATVRQIFLDYVQQLTREGKEVTADEEPRIILLK